MLLRLLIELHRPVSPFASFALPFPFLFEDDRLISSLASHFKLMDGARVTASGDNEGSKVEGPGSGFTGVMARDG